MNEMSFQLILHAGNARSLGMKAISLARAGNFEDAEKLMKEAEKEQKEAHLVQTQMLTSEEEGAETKPNMLLVVHALDHVTAGSMSIDWAYEMINIYKTLSGLN
jgi:PTS system cellobiose-specific IIA component